MKPKLAVILYKSKLLSNGEHPLMLRVTLKGQRKYVALGVSCPLKWWDDKKNLPKRTHPNKDFIKALIEQKILMYQNQLLENQQLAYSPEALIGAVENSGQAQLVFPFFDELIDRLIKAGRIGSAQAYTETRRDLKYFTKNSKLLFTDINQRFLNKYEAYARGKGLAETTISFYFRTLRSAFNKAIKEEYVKEEVYPFKEFNVSKFNTTTRKRAITKEEIKQIASLPLDPTGVLYEARQYFLFSYYGQGINFRDMAFLCWKDIVDGRVFYRRAKTKKQLQFKLLSPAEAIIEALRPLTGSHVDNYVFPILDQGLHITPKQLDYRLDKVLKRTNKGLKEIAQLAGISTHLTMYVARHTYATVLKRSGVAIPVISEAMGHATPVITQTYLKSFEDEVIDEANTFLL
ncbi:MAG: site-specific integrase [Roseivirga sp.]